MTAVAAAPAQDFRTRVVSLVQAAVPSIVAAGHQDLADALLQQAAPAQPGTATVVVVGETKRGKSSLVNALLSRPGLSPVDSDVATSTYIIFRHAEAPWARVHVSGTDEPRTIAVDEVAEWATVAANPGNTKQVRYVEVGLDNPLLSRLTIIDTPGVGGLELGHAELTLQALHKADALLFVMDASAPLSAPELGFLRRATERIDTVILALTKTDLYHGWRTIVEDDMALLRAHAPRFADSPIVPVSSLLAQRALALGPGPDSRELRTEAGVFQVESLLMRDVVHRRGLLGLANTLRLCDGALGAVDRHLTEQVAASQGDPQLRAALEAEQARLALVTSDRAEWGRQLDHRLGKMKLERAADLQRAVRDLRRRYTDISGTARQDELEALPGQFLSEVAALAGRLAEQASTAVGDIAVAVLGELDHESSLALVIGQLASGRLETEDVLATPQTRPVSAADRLSLLQSFSSGRGLAEFAAQLGTGAMVTAAACPWAIPLEIGVGVAYSYLMHRGRTSVARQQDFVRWMTEVLGDAQSQLTNDFMSRMLDVQEELRRAMASCLESRQAEVSAALDTCKRAMAEDQVTRQRRRQEVEQTLVRVRQLEAQVATLLEALRRARDVPPRPQRMTLSITPEGE